MKLPAQTYSTEDATDRLLSSLAHELRTPLSAILLWVKVLSEQEKLSEREMRDGLQAIRDCAQEQCAMIDDFVDSSCIANGKIQLKSERVNLAEEIHRVVDQLKTRAMEKGLELDEKIDHSLGEVLIDPRRFRQVIHGLVLNAIKRGSNGGHIALTAVRRGDAVDIRVRDEDGSISAEKLLRLFERFPSGEGHTTVKNGSLSLIHI